MNQKQSQFTYTIARFLLELEKRGYWTLLGEAYRSEEIAAFYASQGRGISNSNHLRRLAIDLALFKNGKQILTFAEWLEAGELWESMSNSGYLCCWGGRFKRLDCDHFSFEDNGVR